MSYKLPTSYVALDLETNGLPKNDNDYSEVEITEIGWVIVEDGEIIGEHNELCKPVDKDGNQIPQTAKIVEVTGLTDEMLADKEPTLEVMRRALPVILNSEKFLVGSNIIGFDKPVLDKYCDLLNLPRIDESRFVDTAALFKSYRRAHSNGHTHWEVPESQDSFYMWAKGVLAFSWRQDKIKYNLSAAVGYLGIPQFGIPYDRHRAIHDSYLAHKVLEELRVQMSL